MTSGRRPLRRSAGADVTVIINMKARGDRRGLLIAANADYSRYV